MFKNVPDGYNETFSKIIEDFNFFMKNNIEIIKKENKNIENYKIKQSRKKDEIEFYTKNIKIIFKDLDYISKYEIERMYNENKNFESNIKHCLFLLFLNIYYKINKDFNYLKNEEAKKNNSLLYIENKLFHFYYFYDKKSGHFLNNSNLINFFYIAGNFEKILYITNKIKTFYKLKKNIKNIINFFINEEAKNITKLNFKNKTIFYNIKSNSFSDFDDDFKPFCGDLTFIKNNIKELNIEPGNITTIRYSKNKNIERLKCSVYEVIYLKNKKINFLNYSKFLYNNKEYYGYFIKDGVILYDENVNEIKIDISDILEKNSSNLILTDGNKILKIQNNTGLSLKKYDELKGEIYYQFYNFNKKICFVNFNNNYNLIGLFLNCEFFIINKDSKLIRGKNNKKIYKNLMNNYNELIKENRKNNLLINL